MSVAWLNTTLNGTQPSSCQHSTAENIGITFAYCLLMVVSLAGNTFIGIIVYKTESMRKPINFLIVNMAISDLLYPIFVFPRFLSSLYVDYWLISGPLGQALCKLVLFFQDISLSVSLQSVVLIAVDRFGAVVYPLRSPLISSKLCPVFILATWIVASAVFSPDLIAFNLVENPRGLVCKMQWNDAFGESSSLQNYFVSTFVVFLYTPLVLITILYIIIYVKLKSQKIPGNDSINAGRQRLLRERNVLKMAVAVVSGFAVCWLPFGIIILVSLFKWDQTTKSSCGVGHLLTVVAMMARANCAINPCICFISSGNYRKGLKKLLKCS
ncbi:neuropeptide SIFamide receptor-like [Orbicella faveolata]|uniref:neuropeptide SIFamide receptor-like n=1 Tax=Orbicella faveolata TaxID=48498 RepID=UPI0009E1FFE8|nr:neuropeptide SIFamide receptor-like [Orbicella faveolata]